MRVVPIIKGVTASCGRRGSNWSLRQHIKSRDTVANNYACNQRCVNLMDVLCVSMNSDLTK